MAAELIVEENDSLVDWLVAIGTIGAVVVALAIALFDSHRRRKRELQERELWARRVAVEASTSQTDRVHFEVKNPGPSSIYNVKLEAFGVTSTEDSVVGATAFLNQIDIGGIREPAQWTLSSGRCLNARIEFTDLYGRRWFRTQQGDFGYLGEPLKD